MKNKLSETTESIIELLWEGDEPRGIEIILGGTLEFQDESYKITEEIFNEIEAYKETGEKNFKLFRGKKRMSISGR